MFIPETVPRYLTMKASSGVGRRSGKIYDFIPLAASMHAASIENSLEKYLGSWAMTTDFSALIFLSLAAYAAFI